MGRSLSKTVWNIIIQSSVNVIATRFRYDPASLQTPVALAESDSIASLIAHGKQRQKDDEMALGQVLLAL